jgi:SAM-dependent methyltransferase
VNRSPGGSLPTLVSASAYETLYEHRAAWNRRPLIREIYASWYARIARELSSVDGATVELGCGIGTLKEFVPGITATDVLESPWADERVDAHELPYPGSSVGNLVMVDVLHHLSEPLKAVEEAQRVLAPGGRLVMLEPFCSPLSRVAYGRLHHEKLDESVDPFSPGPSGVSDDPWDANIALPTVIFWRRLDQFRRRYPDLTVVNRERLAWLLYPLSGGFSRRQFVPYRLRRLVHGLERAVPLSRLAAFRCLVTLEKSPGRTPSTPAR